MQFRLVEARDLDEVTRIYRRTTQTEREDQLKEFRSGGKPGPHVRDPGSVQSTRYPVSRIQATKSAMRLFVVLTHTVLPWGENLVNDEEDYAVVVVLEDTAQEEVRYFTQIQAKLQARAHQRARARTS
jgi:hypothetical protein